MNDIIQNDTLASSYDIKSLDSDNMLRFGQTLLVLLKNTVVEEYQ